MWKRSQTLVDSLFILSRMADGNPEVIRQHDDHFNCVLTMTKVALEKVSFTACNIICEKKSRDGGTILRFQK